MSDLLDGIGTATEGGLFARALEPDSGARKPHPDQPETCLNCGAQLTGAYCQACGQKGHLHRTIGAFMHDLLHGALHFEGKLWRTLPVLIFRPGKLTRRYIDGERARFVSPMALFLFGVFLMFAVFQMVGLTAPSDIDPEQAFEDTLSDAHAAAETEIGVIRNDLETQDLNDAERAELEERLALLETYLGENPDAERSIAGDLLRGIRDGASGERDGAATYPAKTSPAADQNDERIDLAEGGGTAVSLASEETGVDFIDSAVAKWRANPSLMLYKLQANAYKFSWLLIPISIPFVWLLFAWKRRFKAYDHAIFVTYSLSFMTLLFVTASLVANAGAHEIFVVLPLLIIPPVHLYKQLRGAYELSRFGAFWRLLVLSAFIWIVAALFFQILFLLGST
ncbi:DUF3667 domain-containing protein [Aurantiacibacter marinus]|uniref:DUF3667 domain-containing protein n=1 Tax=Aurantiacibacter marinus TaxID=874156 RepID=A0A0H0XQ79_9SPHN|nr:DUF3667 domain-containing protein [Aurantiacibacter marinus]KLI64484.1 hypothetical protein AAV99_02510 [Aurantiacibacter marinus]